MKLYLFLFRISILFSVLWGAHAWFTWWVDTTAYGTQICIILLAIISIWYKIKQKIKFKSDLKVLFVLVLWLFSFISAYDLSLSLILSCFLRFIPLWVLLSDEQCSSHFQWIKKTISYLLIPGILIHLIYIVKPFAGLPIQFGNSMTYIFYNYFFVIELARNTLEDTIRFQSVFLEPGYLGTLLCFLLYCDRYNFKDTYTKIILCSLILSFSLAGYVISFLGYLIYRRLIGTNISKYIGIIVFFSALYLFASTYNNGDNILYKRIFYRLQFDDDKGIKGYNRNGYITDYYYDQVISSDRIFYGLSSEEIRLINGDSDGYVDETNKLHGAGFKLYVVQHGLVPVILYFLFYYFLIIASGVRRKYSFGFLILIVFTFLQASYPNSYSWLIPFILGINSRKPLLKIRQ